MTSRLALILALLAPQALAQSIDFGTDSSVWANDGECDDPRFQGPGMTLTPLLDIDIGADATDCRTAYESGRITLAPAAAPPAEPVAPVRPVKPPPGGVVAVPPPPPPVIPAPEVTVAAPRINFGDDSGDWVNDGECDDRRFTGQGMANALSWTNAGRDASDCRRLFDAGLVRLWDNLASIAATQCALIDFGDDSGDFPSDGECDDIRFEGPGMASAVGPNQVGRDASDCRQMCTYGVVSLRDY